MEAQSKAKKELDARRFPEIFSTLTETEKQELLADLAKNTGATRMAINYWVRGERTPRLLSTKRAIASSVKKVLNLNVSTISLFR